MLFKLFGCVFPEESLNAQKSQYEGRITKLEKDLQESQAAGQSSQQLQQVQEELEKLKKDNAELINKVFLANIVHFTLEVMCIEST